jgi:hypothetical protein
LPLLLHLGLDGFEVLFVLLSQALLVLPTGGAPVLQTVHRCPRRPPDQQDLERLFETKT